MQFPISLRKFAAESLLKQTIVELRETIKERRATLGITQLDLAEMAEVSLATVKDIERGKGNPSLETILKLLNVLGLEMNFHVRQIP